MTAIPTLEANVKRVIAVYGSNTHPHDLPEIGVLGHEGEVHEALDKEGEGDEVEENLFGMILKGTFKGYVSRELKGMC